MPRVCITSLADADLAEIGAYIAQECGYRIGDTGAFESEVADRLMRRFGEIFERLSDQPMMGRISPRFPELRHFPLKSFLIFYRPSREGVEVVRVLRVGRNISAEHFSNQ